MPNPHNNWEYSFWEESLNTLGLMQTGQEQFPKVPEAMDSVPLPIPEILLDNIQVIRLQQINGLFSS